jgi:hypothetical protein
MEVQEEKASNLVVISKRDKPVIETAAFPHNLPGKLNIVLGQDGKAYATMSDGPNAYALPVGGRKLNNLIRDIARREGMTLRRNDITEVNHYLQAFAENTPVVRNVWYRVAPIQGGVEIALGDEADTRVRITAGKVDILGQGSDTLFYRTPVSRAMAMPAATGNLKLLEKHLNLHPQDRLLLVGWFSYILAHPKLSTSNYPILVLNGGQGTGKSSLCKNVIREILDPSVIGVQLMPNNAKDLAIAAQNAHVLFYDNVREFTQSMSDILCIAATGGSLTSRQLYTDAEQNIIHLHVALVLNGIHSFITQPDLAQRTLPLQLLTLDEKYRKSEAEMVAEFQADLPYILRGLFDLTASVLEHLPNAEVTNPERMIDFVKWLAGMEKVNGMPAGVYQGAYSYTLKQGQLESLVENVLASTVLQFAQEMRDGEWSGTPAELLGELTTLVSRSTQFSRDWPRNAIALSKRLVSLQSSLKSQGITLVFGRGKSRTITIHVEAEKSYD